MADLLTTDTSGDELRALEESLWLPETRFDATHLDSLLAPEFVEIGRSGRRYTRSQLLATAPRSIAVTLPLPDLRVRLIGDVAIVTYISDESSERTHRTSVWRRHGRSWLSNCIRGRRFPWEQRSRRAG